MLKILSDVPTACTLPLPPLCGARFWLAVSCSTCQDRGNLKHHSTVVFGGRQQSAWSSFLLFSHSVLFALTNPAQNRKGLNPMFLFLCFSWGSWRHKEKANLLFDLSSLVLARFHQSVPGISRCLHRTHQPALVCRCSGDWMPTFQNAFLLLEGY